MSYTRQYITSLTAYYGVYRDIIGASRWLSTLRAIQGAQSDVREMWKARGV